MAWRPKRGKYCGENEYSIRPHKPNPVGATPTPATNAPKRKSGIATRLLAERTFVYGRGREWLGRPTRNCKGLSVVNFYSHGVMAAHKTLTLGVVVQAHVGVPNCSDTALEGHSKIEDGGLLYMRSSI